MLTTKLTTKKVRNNKTAIQSKDVAKGRRRQGEAKRSKTPAKGEGRSEETKQQNARDPEAAGRK